jgi:AcrR family transcriptional regulator
VPRLARDDGVEAASGRVPRLEGRDLHRESMPPRGVRHAGVGVDAEHAATGRPELPGDDAGADADIEELGSRGGRDEPLDQRVRIARAGAVVAVRVGAERLRDVAQLVRFRRSGHAPTLVGERPFGTLSSTVPTGVAIDDARSRLFDAAERVLLRDGPNALTSRAVTTEAGVAKGVLHRHFADFDGFLAELVLDRIARLEEQAAALRESAGSGTVIDNLTAALTAVFDSLAREILGLVTSRDALRARLRETTPTGVPVLAQATAMIAAYLAAERDLGRLAPDTGVHTLALMLIGTVHMLFAGRERTPLDEQAVRDAVTTALARR